MKEEHPCSVWASLYLEKKLLSYSVYVIRNANSAVYVGLTTNLRRRLNKHRTGKSKATAGGNLDWELLHKWKVPNFTSMTRLERYLQRVQSSVGDSALLKFVEDHPEYDSFVHNELMAMDVSPTDLKQFTFPWNLQKKKHSIEPELIGVTAPWRTPKYITADDPSSNKLAEELKAKRKAIQTAKRKISNRKKR